MNTQTYRNTVLMAAVVASLTACGSSGDGESEFVNGVDWVAANQTASARGTPYVAITDEELGEMAEVPETLTASLRVQNDFTFETSRTTEVNLSIPEAAAANAEATFCTDYTFDGTDYDVDYDSCILQATLHGGVLQEEIDLANQYNSVLGIVWIDDANAAPIYREFTFD